MTIDTDLRLKKKIKFFFLKVLPDEPVIRMALENFRRSFS